MKKVKDLVEKVKMWVKFDKEQAIVAGILVGSLTIFGLGWFVGDYGTVSNTTHKELQEKYNELENDFNSLQHSKNNYEKLANNATSYNKLNSTEKELVDSYIKEVMEKSEEEKEIESFRNTYKPMYEVVDSGKSYYDMSDTEKAYIDSFLDYNFNDSPQKLQEEYQEKFDFYSTNREESKQRVIDEENARKAAEEEAKRQEEEAKKEAEAHKYETGLTWEDIAREGKIGTLGQFEGKILQVINSSYGTSYRIAINGDYNTVMYVEDTLGKATETLLEDDYVYFKGMSMGTTSYTTVLGAKVTIPSFMVDEIHR
jgi:hypothetical protein